MRGGWTGVPSTWRPWHRNQAAAGIGGKRALSVRTCQKYQAEIRATTPTHPAKNSPVLGGRGWGGGFPTDCLACCPCLVGGLVCNESISLAGQLRPRTGEGPWHALSEKALLSMIMALCQAGLVSPKTNQADGNNGYSRQRLLHTCYLPGTILNIICFISF